MRSASTRVQYERCENGLSIAALAAELWPERWCWKGAEKQVEKGAKEKRRRERRETQRVAFSSSRPDERPLPRTSAHPRPTTHATSPPAVGNHLLAKQAREQGLVRTSDGTIVDVVVEISRIFCRPCGVHRHRTHGHLQPLLVAKGPHRPVLQATASPVQTTGRADQKCCFFGQFGPWERVLKAHQQKTMT